MSLSHESLGLRGWTCHIIAPLAKPQTTSHISGLGGMHRSDLWARHIGWAKVDRPYFWIASGLILGDNLTPGLPKFVQSVPYHPKGLRWNEDPFMKKVAHFDVSSNAN